MQAVIVGNGVAGITAAAAIRERSADAKISIYTDESHPYYPRPRLYDILSGEAQPADIYGFSTQWYTERRITLDLGKKVSSVETVKKELLLEDGRRISYDKLLLANGAHSFVPPVKGVEKTGVFTLRSLQDALIIREYAKKTKKAVVVGGGLLGLEFAASLRKLGQQVDVIELLPRLLPMQLDQDGASLLQRILESRGVNVAVGVKTEEIVGQQTVSGVALGGGKQVSGDLVLFSAGVRSNVDLASQAGIKINRGILVDDYLRTSATDVYAAGDVAEFKGRVYGIIPAALDQAKIAALNIFEKERHIYPGTIPSNTLKIVGIDLASMGLVNPEGAGFEEVKKIKMEERVYKKIVVQQGIIVGAIVLGETRSVAPLKLLMDHKVDISRYKDSILGDGFDFRQLISG